jgi:hypothetical protein
VTPNIFQIVSSDALVQSILKSGDIVRFYLFGRAPQNPIYPYAVWRVIGGAPENYLSGLPDIDSSSVQIDVYASPEQGVSTVSEAAIAIRDAIEKHCYVTSWRGESIDTNTNNLNISFDTEWHVDR